MLEKIKTALGITGTYQDALLQIYIDEVINFLLDAGVSQAVLNSNAAIGVIVRGVADLWNYGSGGTDFSPYFMKRAIQLSCNKGGGLYISPSDDGDETVDPTNDYNLLTNKPTIENVILEGNNTLDEFGLDSISNSQISNITKWE